MTVPLSQRRNQKRKQKRKTQRHPFTHLCGQKLCSAHGRFCSGCPVQASGDPGDPKSAPTACLLTFCRRSLSSRDLLVFLLQVWPRNINLFFLCTFHCHPQLQITAKQGRAGGTPMRDPDTQLQSREGLGAPPCETPTHSCAWGWCFICPWGAEQRCIVSHVFLLHLWSMLIDIYRRGFASSP